MNQYAMMTADEKVQKALMHIVLHKPFYGALIMRLDVARDRLGHPTCWTDGKRLRYSEKWATKTPFEVLVTALAARVAACSLCHPFRRGERDPKVYGEASEHVVNLLLKKDADQFVFPEGALMDERFDGLAVEQVYTALKLAQQQEEQQAQQAQQASAAAAGLGQAGDEQGESNEGSDDGEVAAQGKPDQRADDEQPSGEQQDSEPGDDPEDSDEGDEGQGEGDSEQGGDEEDEHEEDDADEDDQEQGEELAEAPGRQLGDVLDAGEGAELEEDAAPLSPAEQKELEENWQHATATASMQADARGDLSAGALRHLRDQFAPKLSYEEHLQMFVSKLSRDEQSWSRQRRSSVSLGVYLPTMRNLRVGKLVVAIDTSGSIDEKVLAQFQADAEQARDDLKPEAVDVVYIDAEVCGVEQFERDEPIVFKKPEGGGGTDFAPLFAWVQGQIDQGEEIVGVIYLTDLDGDFPEGDAVPEYPVLWVSTDPREIAPFGETAHFDLSR